jgi:iron complex outermembrane receptor protein
MKNILFGGCSILALALPAAAHAQSAASTELEGDAIIVSGTVNRNVEGILMPNTPRAKQVLTQEQLERNGPGQTVLDSINIIPGVTFTNNDAYGSGGGQLSIRGFSADRISLTFDGLPLNDTGNYAIYSNQQLDPEIIDNVNVNLGSTDIDSPTAAASGSTVNYQSRTPSEDMGAMLSVSAGDYDMFRIFGMIDTGSLTSSGLRAFISASKQDYTNPINDFGVVDKTQFNGKLYQPLAGDDYVWIAAHYNENRNNFFGSVPLRLDANRVVGPNSGNRFPLNRDEATYDITAPCAVNLTARPGLADSPNTCGTEFDRRYNPSKTGNIRAVGRFTLTDQLVLTVEPSFQWTRANGGGTTSAIEGVTPAGLSGGIPLGLTGNVGGSFYFGRDLNGDGDILDRVTVIQPSQTRTNRYGVITNLIYDITPDHTVRLAYTLDYGDHRQTGEAGFVYGNGEPFNTMPAYDNPITDAAGNVLQKRDRESKAILHQVSGEYRGSFAEGRFNVVAGLRAPFFKRDLQNNCFTTSDSGFVDCFATEAANAAYAAARPTIQGPQQRELDYNKVLPSAGFTFDLTDPMQLFFNYSKGLQVPGTDALYNSFFFAPDAGPANPDPETTDNFDLGLRYTSAIVQAQAVGWYTKYANRLASAYDPETDRNVYRNLGDVEKYGIDGSINVTPIPELFVGLFGSYLKSEIQDDVQSGENAAGPIFIATAGNRESGAPEYSYGAQARLMLGPVDLGATAKRTGGRYIYDTNLPVFGGTAAAPVEVFGAQTPAYWLVNLDARVNMEWAGLNDRTFVQLNVYNLFDDLYAGTYTAGLNQGNVLGAGVITGTPGSVPNVQIGAPRTVSVSLTAAF